MSLTCTGTCINGGAVACLCSDLAVFLLDLSAIELPMLLHFLVHLAVLLKVKSHIDLINVYVRVLESSLKQQKGNCPNAPML